MSITKFTARERDELQYIARKMHYLALAVGYWRRLHPGATEVAIHMEIIERELRECGDQLDGLDAQLHSRALDSGTGKPRLSIP